MLFRRKFPETAEAIVDGRIVTVAVRVSPRARYYRLSIPSRGAPVLTVPSYGRWPEAEAFLHRQANWLAARLERAPQGAPFAEGAVIPLRGEPHTVVGTGRLRGQVLRELGEDGTARLLVPGGSEHMARRLTDWLKAEAQNDLAERVAIHAAALGVTVSSLRLRTQSSRWGSCSSDGRLNFNWRLILAPPFVLDYVAAHEVAHLVEMNHSARFWDTVRRTLPDMERGRAWLRAHGREVMACGA